MSLGPNADAMIEDIVRDMNELHKAGNWIVHGKPLRPGFYERKTGFLGIRVDYFDGHQWTLARREGNRRGETACANQHWMWRVIT